MKSRPIFALLAGLLLVACGDPGVEINGELQRVVGEHVTLALTQGSPPFAEELDLSNKSQQFTRSDLRGTLDKATNEFSFVIPENILEGAATLEVGRENARGRYRITFDINRLALTVNENGLLQAFPIGNSKMPQPDEKSLGGGTVKVSLSPSGGFLGAILPGTPPMLKVWKLGKTVSEAYKHGIEIQDLGAVTALAIDDSVAVVAAQKKVAVLIYNEKTLQKKWSFDIKGATAVAVSNDGTKVVALHPCSTPVADCLSEIAKNEQQGFTVKKKDSVVFAESTGTAKHLAITVDGKAALVAGEKGVFGARFDCDGTTCPRILSPLLFDDAAQVVSIARTDFTDPHLSVPGLFAVADAAKYEVDTTDGKKKFLGKIWIVGFHVGNRIETRQGGYLPLDFSPTDISFGRDLSDLFAASGSSVFRIEQGSTDGKHYLQDKLSVQGAIKALMVQP